MPQSSTTPPRLCESCSAPFAPKRVTGRLCLACQASNARVRRHRLKKQQALEHAAYLERVYPIRERGTGRPSCLAQAQRWLERGVPIEALILEEDEKAALEAAWTGFPPELRLEAAERLIRLRYRSLAFTNGRLSGNRDDRQAETMDLAFAIIDALEAASGPVIDTLPGGHNGRAPRKRFIGGKRIQPWTPAEESWSFLLGRAYLHHVLSQRKEALGRDPSENVRYGGTDSLDRALGDEDNPDLCLHDVFVGGRAIYFSRSEDEHSSIDGLGACPYDVGGLVETPSAPLGEALSLRLASGRLTNPPVPNWMLEQMRREILQDHGPAPPSGREIEEQTWRAHPDRKRARDEARQRRDAEMETTMHREIIERLDRIEARMQAISQENPDDDAFLREIDAYLKGVSEAQEREAL